MKYSPFALLALTLGISCSSLHAADNTIDTNTARAYEGYLITFVWPESVTSEQIDYQNVLNVDNLLRLPPDKKDDSSSTGASIDSISNPFDDFKSQIDKHAQVLVNKKWTLIFKHPGDVIAKQFYSDQVKDGYPELTGSISIKLGRYLESEIQYKHYLFDSFSVPESQQHTAPQVDTTNKTSDNIDSTTAAESTPYKLFEPALVLNLHETNKTASKKINYIDHPIIGTLLYFEPISLEDALEQTALESLIPDTGESLNYDSLQQSNELSNQTTPTDHAK